MKKVSLEIPGNLVGVSDEINKLPPIMFITKQIERIW
jgi:hypothetical protein